MPSKTVTPEEWRAARVDLLAKEKEHTRMSDELAKQRANLPVVELGKNYQFAGPEGPVTLADMFKGRSQLAVYHFMFDPSWDSPCKSCSFVVENMPKREEHLNSRDTTLAFVSRAPIEKLSAAKERMGWDIDWYSSHGSDFNYDFHVTLDQEKAPVEFNYRDVAELKAKGMNSGIRGEVHGFSVFVKEGGVVYHTYSCYGRGVDHLLPTFGLLDMTPAGRQDKTKGSGGRGLGFLYHDEY
ncbi:hypothetical protein LTR37_001363 [Vermiconidia calcicola]|uniref:Uncharacterized protein n=1 Tax=Vermiconidia calcicola TaxID=1690605 RepID=A0ACC3NWV3_9PEZI|nr:hypothetical protein LTR37_001363 [Vermiconidia calcicola]